MTWEDAQLDTDFDGLPDDAPGTIELTACGFLVRDNEKMVVIALDIDPASRAVRFTLSIPRGMVRSVEPLVKKNAQ